jgi:hypothetical protein
MPQFAKFPQPHGFTWIDLEAVNAVDIKVAGETLHQLSFTLQGGGVVTISNPQQAQQALTVFKKSACGAQLKELTERSEEPGVTPKAKQDLLQRRREAPERTLEQQSSQASDAGLLGLSWKWNLPVIRVARHW